MGFLWSSRATRPGPSAYVSLGNQLTEEDKEGDGADTYNEVAQTVTPCGAEEPPPSSPREAVETAPESTAPPAADAFCGAG